MADTGVKKAHVEEPYDDDDEVALVTAATEPAVDDDDDDDLSEDPSEEVDLELATGPRGKTEAQMNGVMVLSLLDKIIGVVDQIQQTQNGLEARQGAMEKSVSTIQGELAKMSKNHVGTTHTVNKMLDKVRKVSVNVKSVRNNLEKQAGQIKKLESNESELLKRRNFKVLIYQAYKHWHEGLLETEPTPQPGGLSEQIVGRALPFAPLCPFLLRPSSSSGLWKDILQTPHFTIACELPSRASLEFQNVVACEPLRDKVKPPKSTKSKTAETLVEGIAVEGLEQIPEGQEEVQDHLNSDEEVEIEEIIEESRTKRIQRTTKQQVDNIKKAFSKEKMEKTKIKTKENLEKTRQRTRENLEKTRQRTRDKMEKTKHSLGQKMGQLGTRMTPNMERRAKMKSSKEKAKKSLNPEHKVYARSKTTVYRVPPFTFHVKKFREGMEEVVPNTEMDEVADDEGEPGGEENGLGVHVEVEDGQLVRVDSPEMEALLEVTEDFQLVRVEPDLPKAQSE
ncbi:Caveolae-associated protein 1 [Dissostichus eleginoides]|uniref:Caveolae-associated protein 1 n=1 Tax=Dissostichus eleginoides TaxID=100907 RepID=A0AAD9B507_DISEL|nr:Caveolae-associated protein 1 [Dissostichus eleginoides]